MIYHKYTHEWSINDFFYLSIILMPFFSNYILFGGVSVGDFLAFFTLPWVLSKIVVSRSRLCFLIAVVFLCFLNLIFAIELISEYFKYYRLVFYYLVAFFILCVVDVDFERYLKVYTFFSFFFSISIIIQWCLYVGFGYSIPLQLPIPYYEPDTLKIIDHVYRSGGWLKEPSYFAMYITPAMFYFIFNKHYKSFLLVSIAGVLSTSSLFAFVFILAFNFLPLGKVVFLYSLGAMFCMLIFLFFSQQLMGSIFVSRVLDIFKNGGTINDRFLPVFDMLDKASAFFDNKAYDFLLSGDHWFSSISSLMSGLGLISVIFLAINFLNVGVVFALVLLLLVLTTHFMSGVYSFFLIFSLLAVYKNKLLVFRRGAYVL